MNLIQQGIDRHKATLETQGLPAHRAAVKAEGTVIGKYAAGAGVLLIFFALVLVLTVILKGGDVGIVLGSVIGLFGFFGFALFGVGMTLISRDAAPAIAKMGEMLVGVARIARGKAEEPTNG